MSDTTDALQALFSSVSLGAPEKAVGFVLWRVMHRYKRAIDRALAPADLTHLQFTALAMAAWLAKSGEPVTQAALAKAGDIHPMQVSLVLKALEAKGLLTRAQDPLDIRAKRLAVTRTGVRALSEAMPLVVAVSVACSVLQAREGGFWLRCCKSRRTVGIRAERRSALFAVFLRRSFQFRPGAAFEKDKVDFNRR